MTLMDEALMALTAWRENRSGGRTGMQSVINVICNRATERHSSPYEECIRPLQFSSITAPRDPQLALWPLPGDSAWQTAQALATSAAQGILGDITQGATSYYAPAAMKPPGSVPDWANEMTKTVEIAGQIFFK